MYVTLRDVHVLIGAHTGEHIDRSTLTSAYVKQLVRAPVGVVVIVARVARWCRVNDHLNTENTHTLNSTCTGTCTCIVLRHSRPHALCFIDFCEKKNTL